MIEKIERREETEGGVMLLLPMLLQLMLKDGSGRLNAAICIDHHIGHVNDFKKYTVNKT